MIEPPATFDTARLLLRRPVTTDADAIFEYASDPEVTRFMDWPTRTSRQDSLEFLADREVKWKTGQEYSWVITVRPEPHVIGAIACRVRERDADFGYVLNRKYWRQGYATEAGEPLVAWLRGLPTISRVWATCDYENTASARVLEKLGLTCEGTQPEKVRRPNLSNEPRPALLFALNRKVAA